MDFWNLAIRIIFLSQTTTGIMGNFFLIFYHLLLYYREGTLKATELILMSLMLANVMIILSVGVPQTMAVWGLKDFLNHLECECVLYFQGFARSVSICTICLLSVFQTLTISPKKSFWKYYKVKAAKYIGCCIFFLWVLNIFISSISFLYTLITKNNTNMTRIRDFVYCSLRGTDDISDSLYAPFVVCPEIFFSVLIALASVSKIAILYRHKKRVQHIRSNHGSSHTYPESRATQNILIVVSTFLAFCTLTSIIRGCISLFHSHSWLLMNINHFTSLCFPTFAPFVLMSHYSIVCRFNLVWSRKKLSLNFLLAQLFTHSSP
ncbi:vomeronasal type-1 receptor 4-like [Grammomys surdaster]|uniref:vomeronasal type-1 receptor 4-like n=1 Tax=Grammomys surdaster TaxID=491861 RepID=UPI0010A03870|nr:vomeronasal type-1 receptor 4-like [Grammomys surdaster]